METLGDEEVDVESGSATCHHAVKELAQATTAEEATSALLSLSELLDADLVKDGVIQQAAVIRAAAKAKERIKDSGEWPEEEFRQVEY